MWIDTSITVAGERVALSVEYLAPEDRERAAATIAWFSDLAITGVVEPEQHAWQAFLQSVFDHLKFVTARDPDDLEQAWWSEASRAAVAAFVRINGLAAAWTRYAHAVHDAQPMGGLDPLFQDLMHAI
jgi:hypothetical protein